MIEKSKDIHDTQDMTQHTRQACTPHKTQRTTHNAHSTQNTAHRTQHTTYYTQQTMHKHHNIQHKKQHTTQIKLGKHTYKAGTRWEKVAQEGLPDWQTGLHQYTKICEFLGKLMCNDWRRNEPAKLCIWVCMDVCMCVLVRQLKQKRASRALCMCMDVSMYVLVRQLTQKRANQALYMGVYVCVYVYSCATTEAETSESSVYECRHMLQTLTMLCMHTHIHTCIHWSM
jgi:hypothetical protein